MKNSLLIFVPAIAGMVLIFSCSKKTGSGGSQPQQDCQITGATIAATGEATESYSFTYNNQGQISTLEIVDPGFNTVQKVYTYSGNMVYMSATSAGNLVETDTIVMNSNGQVQSVLITETGTGTKTLTTYSFSGGKVQGEATSNPGGSPFIHLTYTWSGGNLSGYSDSYGDSVTFTYNNKPSQQGDYWSWTQLANYAAAYITTANQVIGINSGGSVLNISYSTDSTGKISGFTQTEGAFVQLNNFVWSCH